MPQDGPLPNAETRKTCRVGAFKNLGERLVVGRIERIVAESLRFFLHQGVVIVGFLEIEIDLAVIRSLGNKLPAHGGANLLESHLDKAEKVVGRCIAQFRSHGVVEAKPVAQLLGSQTDGNMDIVCGEAMDRNAIQDAHRHRAILFFRK